MYVRPIERPFGPTKDKRNHTFLRWQQYPNRIFVYGSRVKSRSQSIPRKRYRTSLSREQMSLWFAGYPKTPAATSGLGHEVARRAGQIGVNARLRRCVSLDVGCLKNDARKCAVIDAHLTPIKVGLGRPRHDRVKTMPAGRIRRTEGGTGRAPIVEIGHERCRRCRPTRGKERKLLVRAPRSGPADANAVLGRAMSWEKQRCA
jgi:hypothetical protein